MAKIETYLGELEVVTVWHSSLGYWARTGKGMSARSWSLTKLEYDDLKKQLEKEREVGN